MVSGRGCASVEVLKTRGNLQVRQDRLGHSRWKKLDVQGYQGIRKHGVSWGKSKQFRIEAAWVAGRGVVLLSS